MPNKIVTSGLAVAVGKGAMVTVTVLEFVQPVVGFKTVTVYVPMLFTVGEFVAPFDTMPGPSQEKVAPLVVEDAVIKPEGSVHVNCNEFPEVIVGKGALVTLTVAVFVQPFASAIVIV